MILNSITIKSVSWSVVLVLSMGVAEASPQQAATKKRQQSNRSSSAANKSRPRRVLATHRSDESKPSATDESTPAKAAEPATNASDKPSVVSSTLTEETIEKAETNSSVNSDKTEKPQAEPPALITEEPKDATAPNGSISLREQIESARTGSERIRLQLRLAEQLSSSGQKADAVKELHTITKSEVFDPQGFYNVGNALARLGDYHGAINAYRKAIDQRKGRYSKAFNNLGVVLLQLGHLDQASDAFMSALKLENFHYAEASYNLGRVYAAGGERDLAFREWRRALRVDPEHLAAARALAGNESGIVMRSDLSTKAESANKPLKTTAKPGTTNAAQAGSTESFRAARSSKGSRVLELDPVSYDFLQRARNLKERGKLPEAAENYERVISRSQGYFAPANLELSYVLRTLKRNDEALANLLKVMKRDGARYPLGHYHLARVYESQGDLVLAEQSYANAVLAYRGENYSFLLDLCRVRELQGNFKGALTAMAEYVTAMESQGMKPLWADDRLSVLRQKSAAAQVPPK